MPLITSKSAEEIKGESVRKAKKTPAKNLIDDNRNSTQNPVETPWTSDDQPEKDNQIDRARIWALLENFVQNIPADQNTDAEAPSTIGTATYENASDENVYTPQITIPRANHWICNLGLETIPEDIAIRAELVDLIRDARFSDLLDLVEKTDESPEIRSQAKAYKETLAAGS